MASKKRRVSPKSAGSPTPETPPAEESRAGDLWASLKDAWGKPRFSPFRVLLDFFTYHWKQIHSRSLAEGPNTFSVVPLVVLSSAAGLLALMEYYGGSGQFTSFIRGLSKGDGEWAVWARGVYYGDYLALWGFGYWSIVRFFGYLVLPALLVLLLPGERLSDYGLSLKKAGSHFWLYLALYLAVLPAVVLASFSAGFQKTYPFYAHAGRSLFDFLVFEFFYGLQFFTLEFFFRGFLLHGLKRYMGAYSIFVMLVPYCMIHFGKPIAETIGAIGAGLILGTLSLSTRSIWGGVGIHIAVAVTMDLLALWHKGLL